MLSEMYCSSTRGPSSKKNGNMAEGLIRFMTRDRKPPQPPWSLGEVALENQVQLSHRRDRTARFHFLTAQPFSQWQHQHLLERNGANFQVGSPSLHTAWAQSQRSHKWESSRMPRREKGLRELAASPEGRKSCFQGSRVYLSHTLPWTLW